MYTQDVDRNTVPTSPGVYLFRSSWKKHLYIGKAKHLKKRLQQYFRPWSLWKQDMVAKAHHVERLMCATEEEAILLETDLIRQHKPMYNNLVKGEHVYVYLKIPHEDFPNIILSRYKKNDNATYIWPKVRRKQLKQTLRILRTVLKFRSCPRQTFTKWVVCSDYYFWLCSWRCVHNKKTSSSLPLPNDMVYTDHVSAKTRYDEILKTMWAFFSGDTDDLMQLLLEDMQHAIDKQHFERAAKLRDVYQWLESVVQQHKIMFDQHVSGVFLLIVCEELLVYYVVLTLQKWKIVDIITQKEELAVFSQDDIVRMVEQEYELSLKVFDAQESSLVAWSFSKRLTKKDIAQLSDLAQQYLASYIQSQQEQSSLQPQLHTLQERYGLSRVPQSIECVDISHLWGEHTVGAVTALQYGRLHRSAWRRYRISEEHTLNDYASLCEVVKKRFTNKNKPWPDLFILDGWKAQLTSVLKYVRWLAHADDILAVTDIVALGKGKARSRKGKVSGAQEYLTFFDTSTDIFVQKKILYDVPDRLLVLVRDEAHRFANAYRKKRMSMSFDALSKK